MKVQKLIDSVPTEQESGNSYNQPVSIAYEQGFTYSSAAGGSFTLNSPVAMTMLNAAVTPSQIVLRSQIDYESAARSARGRNAFMDGTKLLFEGMQKSMRKRYEIDLLYGQMGLGVVSSVATNTITITTATWAPFIWAGMEGAQLEAFTAVSGGSQRTGTMTITSVDLDNRTVTVDAAATSLAANDHLFWYGAHTTSTDRSMAGIAKILSNTGSLFGISAATYSLWKASTYAAGSAALSQTKINAAVAAAVAKGCEGEMALLVNPKAWGNLLGDQSALVRHIDPKKNKVVYENGSTDINFHSQNGVIKIISHPGVKEGDAFGLALDTWTRGGAVPEPTFTTPGYGSEIFLQQASSAGFELRMYLNAFIISSAPGKNLYISGIVNS